MREVADKTLRGSNVEYRKLFNATSNYFYKFCKDKYNSIME